MAVSSCTTVRIVNHLEVQVDVGREIIVCIWQHIPSQSGIALHTSSRWFVASGVDKLGCASHSVLQAHP